MNSYEMEMGPLWILTHQVYLVMLKASTGGMEGIWWRALAQLIRSWIDEGVLTADLSPSCRQLGHLMLISGCW